MPASSPNTVERINRSLEGKNMTLLKDGGFDHYRVALISCSAGPSMRTVKKGASHARLSGAIDNPAQAELPKTVQVG
jgi:hypothetical protein